ncbi:hypothetical protein [Kordia sp.]|uniref:hypothetical protein n=1 Tax=Kordia sp. TaxID=1965332 RepID=UPI003D29A84F
MATNFELIFKNNSGKSGDVCIFLQEPNEDDLKSLVWLSKDANPDTTVTFQWAAEYSVVWSETEVKNGVTITSSQVLPAGLDQDNKITLTKIDDAYQFINQTTDPDSNGSITIFCDNSVVSNQATIGIEISGVITTNIPASPGFSNMITPTNKYWIAFGNFTEREILDTETFTKAAEIDFSSGINNMTAILNADDTWTIEPTN